MLFGISIQASYPASKPRDGHFDAIRETAITARDLGFDFVTTGQIFQTSAPPTYLLSPIPLLARLAADLPTMRIMTGVLLVPLAHPLHLVNDLATLDAMCGGRLDIGMGVGYRPAEFENFGVDKKTRGRRFDESLEVMRLLFTQDAVTYDGQFFQLQEAQSRGRSIQTPHPPFWIGGYGDAAIKRAAERGDGWYLGGFAELSVLKDQVAQYRKTIKELGRPAEKDQVMLMRMTWIGEDRERAKANALKHAAGPQVRFTGLRASLAAYDSRPSLTGEEMISENWFAGNPDDVYEQAKVYIEQLGLRRLNFSVQRDPESADPNASLRLLGTEVLPRLRKLAASLQ